MDLERLRWLCGDQAMDAIDHYDMTDESGRMEFVERFLPIRDRSSETGARMAVRTIAINQILDDTPPATWETVERLRGDGLDADSVLSQITMVIGEHLTSALDGDAFDGDRFVEGLESLPLPNAQDIARRLVAIARAQRGIAAGEHEDTVVAELDPVNVQVVSSMVERVLEDLIDGPLHWLPDDATAYVPDLVDGRTFLHRVSDIEREIGVLGAGFDLGVLGRFENVLLPDGSAVEQFSVEYGHLGWRGGDGWLDAYEPDALLAVSVSVVFDPDTFDAFDAHITIDVVDDEPVAGDAVIEAVRAGYEAEFAEPGLPVDGERLMLWLLFHHGELFETPQLPLAELCEAGGLEKRGGLVAHDEATWRRSLAHRRTHKLFDLVPEAEWRLVLARAIEVLDDPDADIDEVSDALASCAEPETLDVLADVFFPHGLDLADEFERDGAESPGMLWDIANRAVAVSRRPRETATAEYLACVLHERCGDVDVAEAHLKRAVDAQPRLGPIVERMGWYRFDRGDARGAMRWWRELEELPEAAATIQQFLSPSTTGRKLGRNDPCWCGSGRKFKQCHQNATDLPALPDRVGWLCRKATTWLEHSTGDVRDTVVAMSTARATGDPDATLDDLGELSNEEMRDLFQEVFDDPIVFDAALHEGGLFSLFLHERGSLLPDDEQLLAALWRTVDRSVHEVVAVDAGVGVTLRDLASGEVLDVRERTMSQQASVGERYCARVVSDGETHQMIGGVFPVRTGHEATVLDLCAAGDGIELCAWVGALHRSSRVVHRPGMIDEMFDREAIEALLDDPDLDEAEAMALLNAELGRQAQARWLDEHIPALGGITPREAAIDPTRREQLERLLDEFDAAGQRMAQLADPSDPNTVPAMMSFDVAALRSELGID